MMRVVLDTSVIVSGMISPHGTPAKIITHWLGGRFILLYNDSMLAELADVFSRAWLKKRLAGVPDKTLDFLEAVVILGEYVGGYANVHNLVRDPFDEMFLICTQAGKADYLVSGDKDLLAIREHAGAKILIPAAFLQLLGD
jgi:putative PIN family toxin of toxin-antitoxin system